MDMHDEILRLAMKVVLTGAGATALMDAWLAALRRMGVRTLDFALLGRWVGHLFRGAVVHPAIGKAAPVEGELAVGWLAHYATGIAFAALLAGVCGSVWFSAPKAWPALTLGAATVAAPLLLMQPAMGAGVAGRRNGSALLNIARSLLNHLVFGLGLYLTALLLARW